MTNQNGFDDFDTQVTAEEFYQDEEAANWRDLMEMDTSGSFSYEVEE